MTSLERTFSLKVPSATENLALIRDFVANVGNQAGLGDDDVAKLELAVDEACANVMEHAHGYDSNKEVTIRATFDASTLRIEVVDDRRTTEHRCPPQGDSHAPRLGVVGALAVGEHQTVVEEVDELEHVALIGALPAEAGALGL